MERSTREASEGTETMCISPCDVRLCTGCREEKPVEEFGPAGLRSYNAAALGHLRDDPALLQSAIDYLRGEP